MQHYITIRTTTSSQLREHDLRGPAIDYLEECGYEHIAAHLRKELYARIRSGFDLDCREEFFAWWADRLEKLNWKGWKVMYRDHPAFKELVDLCAEYKETSEEVKEHYGVPR